MNLKSNGHKEYNEGGDGKNPWNDYIKYSGIAFQMVAVIGLCVWGGIKLDQHFGTSPLFVLVLTFLGIFGSIYTLYRSLPKD